MNSDTHDHSHDFSDLHVGPTLYPSQSQAIDGVLSELLERCPAQFILLVDASGMLLAVQGNCVQADLVALSSLIAGDMAASQEIARMTGQYHTCQMVMREGQKSNTFTTDIGQHMILFMQIATDVPLGWARLLIRETGRQVAEIAAAPPETVEKLEIGLSDQKLSDMVDQALDNLWTA